MNAMATLSMTAGLVSCSNALAQLRRGLHSNRGDEDHGSFATDGHGMGSMHRPSRFVALYGVVADIDRDALTFTLEIEGQKDRTCRVSERRAEDFSKIENGDRLFIRAEKNEDSLSETRPLIFKVIKPS